MVGCPGGNSSGFRFPEQPWKQQPGEKLPTPEFESLRI